MAENMSVNREAMEDIVQEVLDNLETIEYLVRGTQNIDLITQVRGHVFNTGTILKELADEFGLDVDVRTRID